MDASLKRPADAPERRARPRIPVARRAPSVPLTLASVALLVLSVGYIDYLSGTEIRAFPLYFVPLALGSLRLGRAAGLGTAVLCGATWLLSNRLAGMSFSSPAVAYVNSAVMLGTFVVVSLLLTTHRARLEQERRLSRHDSLTGVANPRGFYELAAAELARCQRYGHPLSLAYIDVDDFKQVNDRDGHTAGDALLQALGESLRQAIRTSDIAGRLGGDEFAILLPETGPETALAALERLKARLDRALAERSAGVTISIGAVAFQEAPAALDAIVRQADDVMYDVKRSGKNAIRCEVVAGAR